MASSRKVILVVILAACVMIALTGATTWRAAAQPAAGGPLATLLIEPDRLIWQPQLPTAGLVLTVSGPGTDLQQIFPAGQAPSFEVKDPAGVARPDGTYAYVLRAIPVLDPAVQATLTAAADSPEREAVAAALRQSGQLPDETPAQTGQFKITAGVITDAGDAAGVETAQDVSTPADQVIPETLIVHGNLEVGNGVPALIVQITRNDTPAIRFEQTAEGGFTPQTWDIGANEANFFVRDLTSGSRLPFRIRPGAPTSSIDIAANGYVGIGTASPQSALHVMGAITELSDRNAKENFESVDAQQVLAQLAGLPVTTWNYKTDPASIRHMGPTAQDFRAAFNLGPDDKSLAPLDVNGVTLAAIQALYQRVQAQEAEIEALEGQKDTLQQQVDDLAARLSALEALLAEGAGQ